MSLQIPKQLQKDEFRFILLNGKNPFEVNWTNKNNYSWNDIRLSGHTGNLGVVCGYNNLVVLDIDNCSLTEEFDKKIDSFAVKTGSGGRHYYFICKGKFEKNYYKLKDELGELRISNCQIVCAGSTHPNGNKYEIIKDTEIKEVSEEYFIELLKDYFEKSSSVGSKPTDISRSGREWAEVMKLVRKGYTFEQIDKHMQAFVKWTESPQQYREITYNKATEEYTKSRLDLGTEQTTMYKKLANGFILTQPIFFDKNQIWWMWNFDSYLWEMIDEVDLMNKFDDYILMESEHQGIRGRILEALRKVARSNKPKDAPKSWVQFKDKIVDLNTGREFEASHEWFVTNPLPWELGDSEDTPTIDKFFGDWMIKEKGDEDYINTLYEIIAYSILPDYPLHRIVCLIGSGSNGKSTYIRLLEKFLGKENYTSSDIHLLANSRFECAKLFKKLVCVVAEIDKGIFSKTSLLKRLTGQDPIGFEFKGKTPFDSHNYAKIIIATNTLPDTTDKSDGFYRRWLIVDFPNQFQDKGEIIKDVPEAEFKNLARKSIRILQNLLKKGVFTKEGDLQSRKAKYENHSNPLDSFIEAYFERVPEGNIIYGELFEHFNEYMKSQNLRTVSRIEFSRMLGERKLETKIISIKRKLEGSETEIKTTTKCVLGLKWKYGENNEEVKA